MIYQKMLVQLLGYTLMISYCTNKKKIAWDSKKTYTCLENGQLPGKCQQVWIFKN